MDLWGRYNAKRLIGISSNRTDLGAVRLIPLKLLSHYGRENLSQASSEIQNFNLLSSHLQLTNVCVPSIDVSLLGVAPQMRLRFRECLRKNLGDFSTEFDSCGSSLCFRLSRGTEKEMQPIHI